MSERMMVNRIKRLQELEREQEATAKKIEALKSEIKKDMESKGLEEMKAGSFLVRFTRVITARFDSKAFKAEHEGLYSQYMKQTESRRFSIA